MATKKIWIVGLSFAIASAGGALFYCGGDIDEPSTATTTSAESPAAAAAYAATSTAPPPGRNTGTAAMTTNPSAVPNRVLTPAPAPQLPQPPCTSCPPGTPPPTAATGP